MWFIYGLAGAFFKSLSGYNRKKVSHLSSIIFAWIYYALATIALLPLVLLLQLPVLELIVEHPFITLGVTLTSLLGMLLNVKALSKDELSFVAPLNGLIPIIGTLFGLLFLNELPTVIGLIGIVTIFVGTYIMALQSSRVRWYDPLTHLATSQAAHMSLGVAIFYTLNTIFIKSAINQGFDPLTILYVLSLVGVLLLSFILFTKKRSQILPAIQKHPRHLLASSINSLLGSYLHNATVSLTLVSYALAVRRFDTIFSVLLGWKFLKESNIRNKLAGAVIITIGSALIALFA